MAIVPQALLSSLKSLVPLDIPFNILFCFPSLIIPLGANPKISSTASLIQKDLVTTPDQLVATPEAPLIITQRTGQNIFIDAKVPLRTFFLLSKIPMLSITGALQTMINLAYNSKNPCALISSFGVYGLDGLLRIVEASITDGVDPNRQENNEEVVQLKFKLAFQTPEPTQTVESVGSASESAQNAINEFIP